MPFVDNIKNIIRKQLNSFRKATDISSNGACLVLLYHRVTDYETDPQLLCVTPQNFDRQINYLRSNYNLLTVEEFYSIISSNKKFPRKSVLLTFDDGYVDNLTYALPILEKHSAQALFYICPGNFETDNEFWWDEVERHILLSPDFPKNFNLKIEEKSFSSSNEKSERLKLYQELLPVLRSMEFKIRDEIISSIAEMTGNTLPRKSHRSMTWPELITMSLSPSVVIGAHTVHHPSLAACSADIQQKEINVSKLIIEEKLNKKVDHFSYPFGTKSDYDDITQNFVKECGFKMATANFPYIANRKSDLFAIPRFLVRDWELSVFIQELNSFVK